MCVCGCGCGCVQVLVSVCLLHFSFLLKLMNIWDYFLILSKRQSEEKLIFYLRPSTEPLVKECELGALCSLFSFSHLVVLLAPPSTFLLSFTYFSSFFFMLVHFLCLRLYILRRYFRHLLISLFSLLIHSQCYPSLKLSFPFVCCCFVVKFTLVYCSWQTWKKRVPSNDRMEQKFSFDEQRTICLLIGPAFWAMHILTMERGSNIDNFSVPKRINSPPHPPRIIVSTILSIGLISKS